MEDPVGKPMDDYPTRLAMKHLVLKWVLGDAIQRRIYLGDGLSSQPGSLQLVSAGSRPDICFRRAAGSMRWWCALRSGSAG